jgi:hypothetical protein
MDIWHIKEKDQKMNKLTKQILLLVVGFSANIAFAQSSSELKSTLNKSKLSSVEAYQAYEKLDGLIQAKKANLSMKELIELCLLYSKHDVSDAPYDLVNDLRKSNTKDFDKALNELSKQDREKVQDFLKMAESDQN